MKTKHFESDYKNLNFMYEKFIEPIKVTHEGVNYTCEWYFDRKNLPLKKYFKSLFSNEYFGFFRMNDLIVPVESVNLPCKLSMKIFKYKLEKLSKMLVENVHRDDRYEPIGFNTPKDPEYVPNKGLRERSVFGLSVTPKDLLGMTIEYMVEYRPDNIKYETFNDYFREINK